MGRSYLLQYNSPKNTLGQSAERSPCCADVNKLGTGGPLPPLTAPSCRTRRDFVPRSMRPSRLEIQTRKTKKLQTSAAVSASVRCSTYSRRRAAIASFLIPTPRSGTAPAAERLLSRPATSSLGEAGRRRTLDRRRLLGQQVPEADWLAPAQGWKARWLHLQQRRRTPKHSQALHDAGLRRELMQASSKTE